ncbi:MAG: helix-turn-helix transcriptional regulator [Pseudomonadota bacterium]
MEINAVIPMLDALAQETRLKAFRLLVKAGPDGLAAGSLSAHLDVPHNTLSFHLRHLTQANIVTSHKQGRSVIYAANFPAMRDLLGFLIRDCCSADMARVRESETDGCCTIELSAPAASVPA